MKLDTQAFGLACGIIWGVGLFVLTWWIMAFDGATGEPTLIGRIYRGYSISPVGSLAGLVWGFFDGLVGGLVFAWLQHTRRTNDGTAGFINGPPVTSAPRSTPSAATLGR